YSPENQLSSSRFRKTRDGHIAVAAQVAPYRQGPAPLDSRSRSGQGLQAESLPEVSLSASECPPEGALVRRLLDLPTGLAVARTAGFLPRGFAWVSETLSISGNRPCFSSVFNAACSFFSASLTRRSALAWEDLSLRWSAASRRRSQRAWNFSRAARRSFSR